MRKLIAIILYCLVTQQLPAQVNYFNNVYNYNDFSPALAIVEYNGDYVFSGVTYDSTNNSLSKFLTSIDSVGNVNYWKTVSDTGMSFWAGYVGSLVSLRLKGFIAAGHVNLGYRANALLYRYNTSGDTIWTKQYPDTVLNMRTQFWDCDTTINNGYIMIGYHPMESHHTNVLLIKADSLGNEQWRQEYGNQGLISHGYSVVQTQDSGYLLGCYRYVAGNDDSGDPYVLKVDSVGNIEWERNLGGPYRDIVPHVCLGNDGSYIAGTSISDSVIQDNFYTRIAVFKISTDGDIVWEKKYCQTELDNGLYSIYPDHNGGYIAVGKRDDYYNPLGQWWNEYGWLLKIDEDGDSVWYREYQYYSGTGDDYNDLYDVCLAPDGGYAMVGQVSNWTEPQTAWVIKVDSLGCDTPGCSTGVGIYDGPSLMPHATRLYIYPNPAISEIQVRFSILDFRSSIFIYDLYGRKQDEIIIPKGQEQTSIDVSDYPSGVFIVVLKDVSGIVSRGKFVKSGSR